MQSNRSSAGKSKVNTLDQDGKKTSQPSDYYQSNQAQTEMQTSHYSSDMMKNNSVQQHKAKSGFTTTGTGTTMS